VGESLWKKKRSAYLVFDDGFSFLLFLMLICSWNCLLCFIFPLVAHKFSVKVCNTSLQLSLLVGHRFAIACFLFLEAWGVWWYFHALTWFVSSSVKALQVPSAWMQVAAKFGKKWKRATS
jgi:hypothetical protein